MTSTLEGMKPTLKLGGELEVVRLGYGAMRITGKQVWGPPQNSDEAIRVLRRALELGINLIDTADAYGPNVSEELIAKALVPYAPNLVIATKGGLIRDSPEDWHPDGSPEHLRFAVHGSLERLKLDRIDLYQLHRPDPQTSFASSIRALAELKDEGRIRFVGLSNVTLEQLEEARRIVPIASVQNHYNLTHREDSADILSYCEEQEIAFIPYFPLGGSNSIQEDIISPDGPLAEIARSRNVTPAQIALAWLLHRSPMMLPIPGTTSLTHLEENYAALTIELDAGEMTEIEHAVA